MRIVEDSDDYHIMEDIIGDPRTVMVSLTMRPFMAVRSLTSWRTVVCFETTDNEITDIGESLCDECPGHNIGPDNNESPNDNETTDNNESADDNNENPEDDNTDESEENPDDNNESADENPNGDDENPKEMGTKRAVCVDSSDSDNEEANDGSDIEEDNDGNEGDNEGSDDDGNEGDNEGSDDDDRDIEDCRNTLKTLTGSP